MEASVPEVLESVAETISRYNMFAAGQHVGVAVSGGPDSVCLLHILFELAPRWNLHLEVLHFDHQLRGEESRADAEFVKSMAARLALPFHLKSVDIRACDDNLEQAGRHARLDFFRDLVGPGGLQRVATGHTRSDQAETVLFRILRGTGTTGLAGIRPVTSDGLVRPLIEQRREQVLEWLGARGIGFRQDSTNFDTKLDRNRIRHELLPELEREWNPQIRDTLANLATMAGEEEDFWSQQLSGGAVVVQADGLRLSCSQIASLHPALARRVVRHALQQVKGDLRQIGFAHVERVRDLALAVNGDGRLQLPGVDVMRSFDVLRLVGRGAPSVGEYQIPDLTAPGLTAIPGTTAIHLTVLKKAEADENSRYTNKGNDLDWVLVKQHGPLGLRNWRPGDQYQPMWANRPTKVKFLFQDGRVPSWERSAWPMITIGEQIVWTRRFGAARNFAATGESTEILRIEERSNESNIRRVTSVRE